MKTKRIRVREGKQASNARRREDDNGVYVPHTGGFISQLPSSEGLPWNGGHPVSSVAHDPSISWAAGSLLSRREGVGRAQP